MSGWGATDSDESKPKWLTADQKEDVIANSSGWVVKAGSTMTGNGRTGATPEVLVALGSLATSLGQATIDAVDWESTTFDVSAGGQIIVNVHYNEEITVAGASPLMYVENGQEGGGSASSVTLTMDGSLPFTGDKLTFSNTIGAGGSTISAGDVLTFAAQSINLNGSTMVDKIGGGNAERAISAAQSTAGGTITAVA
ncbi:MAG: hypothetical protein CMJ07_00465 [Pelagibacterales bacterium]|nr:hypothetical protein [Pelagibacterales bacterium]|tara:strand:+ start:15691 stop:16281 length:591 start_codon:yes stop_codon:yes gene_type:complete